MVSILLIDDNPNDRLLAIRELTKAFTDLIIEQVTEPKGLEQAISAGNFDLVVTDYRLRWNDGISVLRAIKERYPDIPVVMFTSSGNEEIAVEGMKAGLEDYVLKSPKHYFRLPVAVRSALEQAQQGQALKEAETRYSNLFDRVPIGLYRITSQGEILEANPALMQLWGYSQQQALLDAKTMDFHMSPETLQQWRELIERDSVVQNFETPLHTLDGKKIWVRHNARAIRDSDGKVLYYEGAIEDVTERKQVEEDRKALLTLEQKARAQAEAASRMKDEFLATLSHELRTPLNAILGWASLLRTRKLNETTIARALETIERNAKAQTQLIEDLLDISRITRGQLRVTLRPVDLILVIDAAIEAVQPTAAAKAIELEKHYGLSGLGEQGQAVVVMGDSNRLQQVIWNLLTNAIKFTPPGGRVEVELSSVSSQLSVASSSKQTTDSRQQATDNYAQIQVKDNGEGISAEFLPHIFDLFRQADSTTTRSQGGLGLGLAIVRQLVEMHGGSVCADSPGIGQGATFTVRLPLLKSEGEKMKDEERFNSSLILRPSSLPLAGLQILLVEDEVDNREMLALSLEQHGAKVVAVSSAAEAKSAIALFEPNIIISDIAMSEEDGYTLMRQMRSQGKQMPAIALTAYARESDCAEAIASGFQRHISKPIDPEELITVVADLVGRG